MKLPNKIRILEVSDRLGWAISRLSRPLLEHYENIDIVYKNISEHRYLASGYDQKNNVSPYNKGQAEKYNIVHFHHPQSCWQDAKELSSKVRKIATKHTERDLPEIDWNVFDDIICPTRYVFSQMSGKNLNANLHYVPYGINLNFYKPKEMNLKSNCVGYVGRVVKWKRFDTALKEAVKAKLKLQACGYVDDGLTFKKEYKNHRKGIDFDWVDFFPEKEMPDFYSRMSLFLCLSEPNIETGTLPILEAMACGIPVISTKIGWAKDNCQHGKDIWFVEEKEIQEGKLSSIIWQVYNNIKLRKELRENALNLIKKFSIEKYCYELMEVYNEE